MSTLVLELSGPLQAWGDGSRFVRRATRPLPSKSGVLGLLAAAQGRRRADSLEDLVGLRFGVRQDQVGTLVRDFQTAIDWRTGKAMPLSQRYYLSDARYLAMVEGDRELLEGLADAVRSPVFPLYLGRRSCPPDRPLLRGLRDGSVEDVIQNELWTASSWWKRRQPRRVQLLWSRDALPGERSDERLHDVPVSFDPDNRKYVWRDVVHGWREIENPEGKEMFGHDPFALLGGVS